MKQLMIIAAILFSFIDTYSQTKAQVVHGVYNFVDSAQFNKLNINTTTTSHTSGGSTKPVNTDTATGKVTFGCAEKCYWRIDGNLYTNYNINYLGTADSVGMQIRNYAKRTGDDGLRIKGYNDSSGIGLYLWGQNLNTHGHGSDGLHLYGVSKSGYGTYIGGSSDSLSGVEIDASGGLKIVNAGESASRVLTCNSSGVATWQAIPTVSGPTGATGPTGAAGATGPTGAAGSSGMDGSNCLQWNYIASVGAQQYYLNTTSYQSATRLYIDTVDLNAVGESNWLHSVTVGSIITITNSSSHSNFGVYTISAITDTSRMVKFTISLVSGNGTASGVGVICYSLKGAAGATGPTGATGTNGSAGATGPTGPTGSSASVAGTTSYVGWFSNSTTLSSSSYFQFDTTSRRRTLSIGAGRQTLTIGDPTDLFQVINNGDSQYTASFVTMGNNLGAGQNNVHWYRGRGTLASPSATQSGDFFMSMGFRGYGTSAWSQSAAAFQCFASENWTNSAQGTGFAFETTPNGSSANSRARRMTIDNSGTVLIGSVTTPISSELLSVQGSVNTSVASYVKNGSSGNAAYTAMAAINNLGNSSGIYMWGGSFTTSGIFVQDGTLFRGTGAGGVILAADNASGTLKLYAGGSSASNLAMTISNGNSITLPTNATTIAATGTGSNGLTLKNLKNSTNTSVSGTPVTIQIDIAGTPYYFLAYPTTAP